MTEYAMPITDLQANLNGHTDDDPMPVSFVSESELTLPRVDPTRGVFITTRNEEIELSDKPVSALIVERLQQEGKPKIPMIEVTVLGKHKQLEPHAGHPGYLAMLAEWQADAQMRVLRYLFVVGTKGKPPQSFVDEQATFFPNASDVDMKYLWIASRLPDDDMGAFTEAIMGRTLPTTKGVNEVANFTE